MEKRRPTRRARIVIVFILLGGILLLLAHCSWDYFTRGGFGIFDRPEFADDAALARHAQIWQTQRPNKYWMVLEYREFIPDGIASFVVTRDTIDKYTWTTAFGRSTEGDDIALKYARGRTPDGLISGLRATCADTVCVLRVRWNKQYGYIEEACFLRRASWWEWEEEAFHVKVLRFEPIPE